jgi:hypothetical protein
MKGLKSKKTNESPKRGKPPKKVLQQNLATKGVFIPWRDQVLKFLQK